MIRDTFDFAAEQVIHALGDVVDYEGRTISAVYGAGFTRLQSGEVRLSSRRLELSVRLDDLPRPPEQGDRVEVRGITCTVAEVRPDIEDVSATLVLKRAD